MSLRDYMKKGAALRENAPVDTVAAERDIEEALALIEREIGNRYPLARTFLPSYRNDARSLLKLLRARWREEGR